MCRPGGERRGTFLVYWDHDPKFVRVRWDDFDFDFMAEHYGKDYAVDAKALGQCVLAANIAKVGSPRFALNDL